MTRSVSLTRRACGFEISAASGAAANSDSESATGSGCQLCPGSEITGNLGFKFEDSTRSLRWRPDRDLSHLEIRIRPLAAARELCHLGSDDRARGEY